MPRRRCWAPRSAQRVPVALRVAVAALSLATISGCGLTHLQDLNFRVDNRLHFTAPKDRSLAHQPITLRWRMDNFRIAAKGSEPPSRGAGYFAIFVDHTPIKPGQTMKAVASDDHYCQRTPSCPNADYLTRHEVYTTTSTVLTIPLVTPVSGNKEKVQTHTFIVVLMDTSGHRIGESAWELDLRIRKVS